MSARSSARFRLPFFALGYRRPHAVSGRASPAPTSNPKSHPLCHLHESPLIYFDVLPSRTVPRMVLPHPGHLERPPACRVAEGVQGPPKRLNEGLWRVVEEHEAELPLAHRVAQPAHG